jgi:hypothetical protein
MTTVDDERTEAWLAFLRAVSAACPGASVHGELSEGFSGEGDVDLLVPRREWGRVEGVFAEWAAGRGLAPAISCRHRAGVLVLVALDQRENSLFEVESRAERFFRGALLFSAEDFTALTVDDPGGFRRLGAGAAGVIKLFPSGLGRMGRPAWSGAKLERVGRLLAEDPDGVHRASALLGPAAPAARAGARAVAAGRWDRRAMLALELRTMLKAALRPRTLVGRARFRLGSERDCALLRALMEHGRRVPTDRARWLDEVAATHSILDG